MWKCEDTNFNQLVIKEYWVTQLRNIIMKIYSYILTDCILLRVCEYLWIIECDDTDVDASGSIQNIMRLILQDYKQVWH